MKTYRVGEWVKHTTVFMTAGQKPRKRVLVLVSGVVGDSWSLSSWPEKSRVHENELCPFSGIVHVKVGSW